jgi:NarL family two-component system response regulator LiaR
VDSLHSCRLKRLLVYGAAGGVLIALLKVIEYKHFVQSYPSEMYGGLIAVIFIAIGLYLGSRRHRDAASAPEPQPQPAPDEMLKRLGITPREYEILQLIAHGLSNREIGERLFVSENTVKTHSSRLFGKLEVNRRVQAVQRGRELGLIR